MKSNIKILEYDLEKININNNKDTLFNIDNSRIILKQKKDKYNELNKNINNNEIIISTLSNKNDKFEKMDIDNKYKQYNILKNEYNTVLNDIQFYTNLLKELEEHEYNPKCVQCMKNPKVLDLIKYSNTIKSLNESKNKYENVLNALTDIESLEIDFQKNKKELSEKYKIQNEETKELKNIKILIDDLEKKLEYHILVKKIKDENDKWINDNHNKLKNNKEHELKIIEESIKNKNNIENKINELIELKNILLHNEKIDVEIKEIKNSIEKKKNIINNEYEKYLEQKSLHIKISMEIMKINISILEKNNIITKEENVLNNINSKLEIIIKNNEIIKTISEMKSEIKNIDNNLNKMKSEKYKLDELIKTNDIIIKNYDDKKSKFLKLFEEKEIYSNYMEIVNKNGLPLHILKRYLTHISDGINFIAEPFIKKKIDLYIEDNDIVLNIIVKDDDNKNRNIMMLGGRESFILDIAFKIVLAKIAHLPKSNFIFIDEGISVFDKEHLNNITDLFSYLNNYFDYVFLMSHIEEIKDYVSKKIYIKRDNDGFSVISYV
jgi:DNA repair exonuclease SbcCD ATPase subunit